jgi:hypothetical protein
MKKKIIYWLPRILTILFILFISIFALDVFSDGHTFPTILLALLMHLIPGFALLILLLIAWKWEKIGGILFILLAIIFTIWFNLYRDVISFLIIGLPVLAVGILFLISAKLNKNKK